MNRIKSEYLLNSIRMKNSLIRIYRVSIKDGLSSVRVFIQIYSLNL